MARKRHKKKQAKKINAMLARLPMVRAFRWREDPPRGLLNTPDAEITAWLEAHMEPIQATLTVHPRPTLMEYMGLLPGKRTLPDGTEIEVRESPDLLVPGVIITMPRARLLEVQKVLEAIGAETPEKEASEKGPGSDGTVLP